MAEGLQLTLLGNPEVRRDGSLVTDLRSRKAMALLCYLAVTGRPHLRPILVGLLWGEMPEDYAQNSLSKALTHLRITRQEAAFDRERPYWLDVEVFEQGASALADRTPATKVPCIQAALLASVHMPLSLPGIWRIYSPARSGWSIASVR